LFHLLGEQFSRAMKEIGKDKQHRVKGAGALKVKWHAGRITELTYDKGAGTGIDDI